MYRMPAEYAPHRATLMIWPVRPGSWGKDPGAAQAAFLRVFEAVTQSEDLYLLAGPEEIEQARAATACLDPGRLHLLCIDSDDAWARDVGPTFVQNEAGQLKGISWRFNAWGGEVDGLYADWRKDDAVAPAFCRAAGLPWEDAAPFVLEGGSIHSDGEGTLLVTESCLLSAGRNPSLSRDEIEAELCRRLGAEKVLWLPRGIYNDETNEHVDNFCAFVGPAEVVLAWTDDENDPQYPLSAADLDYLQRVTDAKGRKLTIHKLPIPDHPILCSEADCDAYEFAPGEGGWPPATSTSTLPTAPSWCRSSGARTPPAMNAPAPFCARSARDAGSSACPRGTFCRAGETSTASPSRYHCKSRRESPWPKPRSQPSR